MTAHWYRRAFPDQYKSRGDEMEKDKLKLTQMTSSSG